LARSSKIEAENRYARAQKRAQEAVKATTDAEVEAKRVDANTARLKALRLARDEADRAAAAAAPPAAKKAKKKPVAAKAIPVTKLNARNDG
jgi:hypothetical protein